MKIYVYLDESGSIHKNSKTRYFAIGEYFSFEQDKIRIFNKIQDIDTFQGCVKVFDKQLMRKEIVDSNIFFNYAVKALYGIQLADLIVNTFYNKYKDIKIVENVIKELKPKNFRVSLFPRNICNKK